MHTCFQHIPARMLSDLLVGAVEGCVEKDAHHQIFVVCSIFQVHKMNFRIVMGGAHLFVRCVERRESGSEKTAELETLGLVALHIYVDAYYRGVFALKHGFNTIYCTENGLKYVFD